MWMWMWMWMARPPSEVAQLRQRLVQEPTPAAAARDPAVFTKTHSDTFYGSARGFIISGGNFHGEYPAKVLDYLAIGVAELASISERRIERLVNPSLSGLPAFLVGSGGLHSGFIIAHCTAAAAVSENKVLCHPSSVNSISTSGSKEDHVSMGGFSARKALEVIENTETVVAIELLAACQAIEFLRPLRTTPALEAVHALVRKRGDRFMAPGIDAVAQMLRAGEIWATAEPFITGEGSAGAQQSRSLL
jgi:histidine ammonia-lyase